MHVRLFNKPHGDVSGCTLAIVGKLPTYNKGEAYEGRLNVSGARGSVMLTSWTGELPPGAQVSFDSAAQQIVVKWPDYDAGVDDLGNMNFEAGDDGSWDKGAGWTIMQGVTAPDPNDPGSLWQAQFANQGGESEIISRRAIKAVPGKTYTASVDVQQGASSKNHAGAAVRLRFFDASGGVALVQDGNVVKSGSNSEWSGSSVTVVAPADAATVKLGAAAFRNHENASLWVDGFVWNGAYASASLGTNGSASYPVTFTVRDSYGCRSTWEGTIAGVDAPVIASLTFNEGLTVDATGREWAVNSATITDQHGNNPVAVPYQEGTLAKEGASMSCCPDSDSIDGTFDYINNANAGIYSALGDDAPGTDTDFCLEMYVRGNAHSLNTNAAHAFAGLGSPAGSRADFDCSARFTDVLTFENVAHTGLSAVDSVAQTAAKGDWFHYAVTRKGDVVTVWYNGTAIAHYSGGSSWNLGPTDALRIGHANGSIASTLGWQGQVDDVRLTVGWARYTDTFTPPTPPYPAGR